MHSCHVVNWHAAAATLEECQTMYQYVYKSVMCVFVADMFNCASVVCRPTYFCSYLCVYVIMCMCAKMCVCVFTFVSLCAFMY